MKTLITITMPDGRMGQVWWEAAHGEGWESVGDKSICERGAAAGA